MQHLYAPTALLATGWADHVLITVSDGHITAVSPATSPPATAERLAGPVLPGLANVHSHAFQRALAGLTETRCGEADSFWTWRARLYAFLQRLDPDTVQALAEQLYIELLQAGYTAVGEFHYLHHDPAGHAYADPAELSERTIAAAHAAGIALTHLPALYAYGGCGGQPPESAQRRFLHDADRYAALLETLHQRHSQQRDWRLGMALHSLRAVDPLLLEQALALREQLLPDTPVHIHIAEQAQEVADCLAWSGQRPVAWLLEHAPVDERWCLIHATHIEADESKRLAASGAVVGLCPTTEANLGDGIFPAEDYLNRQPQPGRFGIGSDSHIEIDPAAELRLLEYGQRLTRQRRAVLASAAQPSVGGRLYRAAAVGGAQALGLNAGTLAPGQRADLLVLDAHHPALWEKRGDAVLDSWLFTAGRAAVRDVMVGGVWRVRSGRHPLAEAVADRYRAALRRLQA